MTTELEIFTAAASSDAYVYLSLIAILGYAACILWFSGKTQLPASLLGRAI
jgi:hypothetical protein